MRQKKVKAIRKLLRERNVAISAEPYVYEGKTRISSTGRILYQRMKGR